MAEKHLLTQKGLDELKAQLADLFKQRTEVIVALQEARAQGDLSENADYDAARDDQAKIEAKIKDIEATLNNYELYQESDSSTGVVGFNSVVTIQDLSDNEVETWQIVSSTESDPFNGKLSYESPLAKALDQHKAGDIVDVKDKVEIPYQVKIITIE